MEVDAIDWGSVPDWLASIGTVGALLLTYRLLRHELAAWRADRVEQEHQRGEALRAQARTVASWIEDVSNDGESVWIAYVSNSSAAPVFSCEIQVTEPLHPQDGPTPGAFFAVVPPGGQRSWRLDRAWFSDEAETIHALNTQVRFTDSQGRHWRRNWYGELEPTSDGVHSC
jgi:hypothetical protein